MTYEIVFTNGARRDLNRLPPAVLGAVMVFIRTVLAENPQRAGTHLIGELAGRMSARRGEYRIIYEIFDEKVVVEIVNMQHRTDVYRTS